MSTKIAILSDTHDLLRPEVMSVLQDCQAIIHAGDLSSQKIYDILDKTAELYAVRGNNDHEWAEELPQELRIVLHGIRVYVTHKKKDIPADISEVDLVIYGHSHRYDEKNADGVIFLNPGSCGPRRFHMPITMAVVKVAENGEFSVERVDIPHPEQNTPDMENDEKLLKTDPQKLVKQVVAGVQKGKSTSEIARKLGISEALAENISRMYLTHPGVTTEGILRRLGI